jgi:site-specific DNA-methyltransferase (adenine-specific)
MNIKERSLSEITPYEKNGKLHPTKQINQIAESIKAFGFNQPIVVDKDDVIIVGHGRYVAAQQIGLEKVPVLTVDLTEEQAKAYRLADNKLNESDWDMELVISELKELSMPMIDLTGFDRNLVLEREDDDDVVPSVPSTPRTKLGDIYFIGRHKIVCGDATKKEDWENLVENIKADCVFTDPPCNVNYKGQGENTTNHFLNDKMSDADFAFFLNETFKNIRANIKGGAGTYVFHSSSTQTTFAGALIQNDFEIKNQLIWNKPMAALGWGDYRWKHEPFFYCAVKGNSPQFYGDRTHSTVIDFQKTDQQLMAWAKRQHIMEKEGKMTIWSMKRESVSDYVHPTQKPVELIIYALTNSTKTDDIVLDPFLGSGSTLIACEKTGRICYGMELDPRYVDTIIQRFVDYTKNDEQKPIVTLNGQEITW